MKNVFHPLLKFSINLLELIQTGRSQSVMRCCGLGQASLSGCSQGHVLHKSRYTALLCTPAFRTVFAIAQLCVSLQLLPSAYRTSCTLTRMSDGSLYLLTILKGKPVN